MGWGRMPRWVCRTTEPALGESVTVSAPVATASGLPGPLLLRSTHPPHCGTNRSQLDFLFMAGASLADDRGCRHSRDIASPCSTDPLGSLHDPPQPPDLSLIHISEPTRQAEISYAV